MPCGPFLTAPPQTVRAPFRRIPLSRRQCFFPVGSTHFAYRLIDTCLPVPLRHVTGATVSDYYEDSVLLDLAIRRESRICAHETFSTRRCPFVLSPVPYWFLTGSSPERAFHLQRYHKCIRASPLQRWCGGCGVHRRNSGLTTQSHHMYRTCETMAYISSPILRFHWHAIFPFGFHRQVSQRPRGDLLSPSPGSPGIS